MGISEYNFNKILHDIKRLTLIIPILRDVSGKDLKERVASLALAEIQKIYDDLEEIKDSKQGE